VIEVGEYIRTKEGKIGKIINITISDKGIKFYSIKWDIIKYRDIKTHSKNIIDLIEVDDIVNGCRVMSVLYYLKGKKGTRVANFKLIDGQTYTGEIDYEGKKREFNLVVETILTHEQYEQNCYKESDIE
jgi:hypothetical protein